MNRSIVWTRKEKSIDISIPSKKDEMHWNPSITWHKKELFVSYRGYRKDMDSFRDYKTPLVIAKLKDDEPTGIKELKPTNVPDYVRECGIEDVRIWSDGKDLYGIGVLLSPHPLSRIPTKPTVRLGEIKIDYENGTYDLIKDFGQPRDIPEKNWSPIEGKPHQYMYSVDSLYKDGEILLTTPKITIDSRVIHNGTPLVKIKDGYIAVAHQRTRLRNRIGCYPNAFIKYDGNLVPTHCTDWFVFKDYMDEEVQFMGGAALLDKNTLGITVGLDRITARRPALYKSLLYKVKLDDIGWQPYQILPLRNGFYKEGDK